MPKNHLLGSSVCACMEVSFCVYNCKWFRGMFDRKHENMLSHHLHFFDVDKHMIILIKTRPFWHIWTTCTLLTLNTFTSINPSAPSAVCLRQWTGSALVRIMVCRMFGVNPLPEPMRSCCQINIQEQLVFKFESKYNTFHGWKCKISSVKWRPIFSRGDEFKKCGLLQLCYWNVRF